MLRKIAICLVIMFSAVTLCYAVNSEEVKGIGNFHKVEKDFYRGGQPDADGIKSLKALGVKTVIDFRTSGDEAKKEKAAVEGLGMKYMHIPFRIFRMPPPDDNVRNFLDTVKNPVSRPVFVHCRHGRDRTGMMVAAYRVAVQGWQPRKAYEEAMILGMRVFYLQMKWFILKKAQKFRQ